MSLYILESSVLKLGQTYVCFTCKHLGYEILSNVKLLTIIQQNYFFGFFSVRCEAQ